MKKRSVILILCLFLGFTIFAQKRVTGVVNDSQNLPVPGVTIMEKGTTNGVISDANGNFSLEVAGDASVLVFSFVGMETQEVTVGAQTNINVIMVSSVSRLDEVIVVGYGTQTRTSLTGSVTDVRSDRIANKPVSSVASALQGEAAGVSVVSSGGPGQEPTIRIRGIGSVNFASNPLYVVDGVPVGSIENIDPNSIQSVSVLKDAASAAIYGSRAANGVLLISTKKGSRDGQVTVNVDYSTGVQTAWKMLDLMNSDQYIKFATQYVTNAGAAAPDRFSAMNTPIYPGATQTFADTETDWQDEMFRTAPITRFNLDLSGGSDKYRFYTAYSMFDQDGILLGTDYKRHNFMLNAEYKVNDFLTIGENISGSFSERNNEKSSSGRTLIKNIINQIPYIPARIPENAPGYIGGYRTTSALDGSDPENPLRISLLDKNLTKRVNIISSVYAELAFTSWLKFKTTYGIEYTENQNIIDLPIFQDDYLRRPNHELTDDRYKFYSRVTSNQLTFDKKFGVHDINAVAVVEEQITSNHALIGRGNHSTNLLNQLQGTSSQTVNGNLNETALISYVARLNYSYADKYLLSASFRRDGSSVFAPGKKWGNFPGASLGWVVSKEDFMSDNEFISNLKLRASYGTLGFNAVSAYPWQSTISYNTWAVFNNDPGSNQGAHFDVLPNTDLEWEITTMTNVGFDLSVLDHALTFSAEYYKRKVDNLLVNSPLAPSLGYSSNPLTNVGSMENSGLEFNLGYRKYDGDFKFSVSANLATVKNEVTSLGPNASLTIDRGGETSDYGGGTLTRTQKGKPVQGFYGYVVEGIFQSQAEVNALNAQAVAKYGPGSFYQNEFTSAGDLKFKDLNNDGIVDDNDRKVIGNYLPDFSYGLNFTASYKNFDLSMQLQGVYGNEIYSGTKVLSQGMMRLFNMDKAVQNAWTPSNTNTNIPRAISGDPANNARTSDRFIEDGSYMRIKNLTIGYNVPNSVINNVFRNNVKGLRFYVTSNNLLTITNYYGYDPEIASRDNNTLTHGVDFGQYPQARSFLFGVKATF